MPSQLDTVFSPSLYLNRDKQAIAFIEDQLLHQETCAAVCMYGNGKDYLFSNVVRRMEQRSSPYKLKVLNTVSADELQDFATQLEEDHGPTLCLVNLRVHKDVSWFIEKVDALRAKRGYAFVSFIDAYVGDIYQALLSMERPITHSLVVLGRVPYDDAIHIINELSDRFGFHPSSVQRDDIYRWSYGHVGLLRTLYLLKRQSPDVLFMKEKLLQEPTVLERLRNIVHDLPAERMQALQRQELDFTERALLERFGYIDPDGKLFHPLLAPLIPKRQPLRLSTLSITEERVLAYLRAHAGETIAREDIARIVWGEEEWEDKYSDWAIGQLIYRLRKKMSYSAPSGTIETRKGRGFSYAHTVDASQR